MQASTMNNSHISNAFYLSKGRVNLTSGTYKPTGIFLCVVAGSLTVTWDDASTAVIQCVAGDAYSFREGSEAKSVAITTGTFHIG